MRYKPWGEVRYSWTATQSTTPSYKLTDYTFTGQATYMDDLSTATVTEGFGLMFYRARFYDPSLGRFAQADTIVPGGVQGLDRYAYVNNNPVRYTDPTGHKNCEEDGYHCPGWDYKPAKPKGGITFTPPPWEMTPIKPSMPTINDLMLFSKSDTCYVMLHDSRLCSPDAQTAIANGLRSGPYSIQSMSDALFNPNYMAGGLSLSSTFLGYGEEMADVHIPFIGIALDAGSQLMQDSNQNYSALQLATRAGVVAVEGQVIALPAASAVGALTVIGLPTTGPIGLPLSATAYISVNAYGSNVANQINQEKIFPAINYYLP